MDEIKAITLGKIIDEGQSIFKEHYEEIATNKELMKLDPDYEVYASLDKNGKIFILGAFQDGQLVGYSLNIMYQHLHYSGLKICTNDILFIQKKHRKGGQGAELILKTEEEAKARGVKIMMWPVNKGSKLDSLMKLKNYKPHNIIYSKEL